MSTEENNNGGTGSTTLVTACFDMRKYNPHARNVDETMKGLVILLKAPVNLIIHTDKTYIDHIKRLRKEYGFDAMTIYVEEEFEDLWCAKYLKIVNTNRDKYWPTKDLRTCAESHLLCCNKFVFVQDAIIKNPFQSERFGWIDGSLYVANSNAIKICENYTSNMIPYVLSQIQDQKFHIQILNVNDKKYLNKENKREFYEQYRWVVCGSFFVCGAEIGMKILERLKGIMISSTLDGYGHAEEMFFLEALEEFPDDIVRSYGDYNQILNNFIHPTKNIWYIVEVIIKAYHNFGYYKECIACCECVLYSYDNFLIEMDYNLYMRTMCFYYMSVIKLNENNDNKELRELESRITQRISRFCELDSNAKLVWQDILETF
jgi:Bacterial protein of unknown function (HtrL_YibB)